MEPPKKRKLLQLPTEEQGKGALVGHTVLSSLVGGHQLYTPTSLAPAVVLPAGEEREQQNDEVSNSEGGEEGRGPAAAARRNRRKYSVDFKVDTFRMNHSIFHAMKIS